MSKLRKYGNPPDKHERATQKVLEQAEVLVRDLGAHMRHRGQVLDKIM